MHSDQVAASSSELALKTVEKWWKPPISPGLVRELLKTRDAPGLLFFIIWLGFVMLCGAAVLATRQTLLVFPLIVIYGTVLSFAYACSHECAHRTAFRTAWINEVVFYVSSFIYGEEPMYRRYTHISHHAKTWYPGKDAQMTYRNPITLLDYVNETSGLSIWWGVLTTMVRHATGRLLPSELEVVPEADMKKLIWGSRAFISGYFALAAIAVLGVSILPLYLFFLPRFIGGWVVHFFINTQHMCMAEGRADHRESTRSFKCSRVTRFLYWNMNFHIEHHLFPGVPFHNLSALSTAISYYLPLPETGAIKVNLGILRIIRAQRYDPSVVAKPRYGAR
jgi:fatty acid desaturase